MRSERVRSEELGEQGLLYAAVLNQEEMASNGCLNVRPLVKFRVSEILHSTGVTAWVFVDTYLGRIGVTLRSATLKFSYP